MELAPSHLSVTESAEVAFRPLDTLRTPGIISKCIILGGKIIVWSLRQES
jgi:hypothetical protein